MDQAGLPVDLHCRQVGSVGEGGAGRIVQAASRQLALSGDFGQLDPTLRRTANGHAAALEHQVIRAGFEQPGGQRPRFVFQLVTGATRGAASDDGATTAEGAGPKGRDVGVRSFDPDLIERHLQVVGDDLSQGGRQTLTERREARHQPQAPIRLDRENDALAAVD